MSEKWCAQELRTKENVNGFNSYTKKFEYTTDIPWLLFESYDAASDFIKANHKKYPESISWIPNLIEREV